MNVNAETEEKKIHYELGLVGKQDDKTKGNKWILHRELGINNKPRMRNIQKQQQVPSTSSKSPRNELEDMLCSKGNERKMTSAKADAELY